MARHWNYKNLQMSIYRKALICMGLFSIHSNLRAESRKMEKAFDSINDHFSMTSVVKDHQFGEFFLMLIAGIVLFFVVWLAYQFFMHRKKISSPDTAWGLYRKLCQVHNLSVMEMYLVSKISRQVGLDDPLPLFVEPNYIKQVLADKTMARHHPTVQVLLEKIFGCDQEILQQTVDAGELSPKTLYGENETMDDNLPDTKHSSQEGRKTVVSVIDAAADHRDESSPGRFEESLSVPGGEKQSPSATKVLLKSIPGRTAFSSLVEPFRRISTEIAATSIQHHLMDGSGMNERTYDATGKPRRVEPELQPLLFPKANVPSPNEMLTGESQRTDQHSPVSPTPQYLHLRTKTAASTEGPAKRPSDAHANRNVPRSKTGDAASFEETARLETIVMQK